MFILAALRLLFDVVFRFVQWFGNGRCEQRDGCFILRSVYFVHFGIFMQWDAYLLYLDVDIFNGRHHGFIYRAALHFIIV